MKNVILVFLFTLLAQGMVAQDAAKPKKEVKTTEFKVKGNCEQCKKRIESAAFIKGVKSTLWDEEKQSLKVVYRADKVTDMQIQEAVAKSGHETEKVSPDKAVYQQLPECCKYLDKDCTKKK